jgi:hypothetical protein
MTIYPTSATPKTILLINFIIFTFLKLFLISSIFIIIRVFKVVNKSIGLMFCHILTTSIVKSIDLDALRIKILISYYNELFWHYCQRSRLSQVAGVRTRICRLSCFHYWSLKFHFFRLNPLFAMNRCWQQYLWY